MIFKFPLKTRMRSRKRTKRRRRGVGRQRKMARQGATRGKRVVEEETHMLPICNDILLD